MRKGYAFEALMACPHPKSGQVPPSPARPSLDYLGIFLSLQAFVSVLSHFIGCVSRKFEVSPVDLLCLN